MSFVKENIMSIWQHGEFILENEILKKKSLIINIMFYRKFVTFFTDLMILQEYLVKKIWTSQVTACM